MRAYFEILHNVGSNDEFDMKSNGEQEQMEVDRGGEDSELTDIDEVMRPKKKVKMNEKTSKEVVVPDGIEAHEEQEVVEVEDPKGKRKEMAAKPKVRDAIRIA